MSELLMHNENTLPKNVKKFWNKRYSLFKRHDEGIYMTAELWYSVTPEEVALFVAKLVYWYFPQCSNVLDVCCGGGGNTIQFARYFDRVGAIDINQTNVDCTLHNCSIYEVDGNVWSQTGDWCELINDEAFLSKCGDVDFIFSSPPWGGPAYKNQDTFDLNMLIPLPLKDLLLSFKKLTPNIGLFLPRNLDLDQLSQISAEVFGENKCRVIYVNQKGWTKGVVAFWGDAFIDEGRYLQCYDEDEEEEQEQEN